MSEIRKFPNGGFDVTVVSRKDIMQTIKDNIKDPEIVEKLIENLEVNAANIVNEGGWAGIPFLGNIRSNPVAKLARAGKELDRQAFETMNKDEYIMFVKTRHKEAKDQYEAYKFYRYKVSKIVARNYKSYLNVAKEKGELYARLYCYFKHSLIGVGNELIDNNFEEEL